MIHMTLVPDIARENESFPHLLYGIVLMTEGWELVTI